MAFDQYVGIDYSGAATAGTRSATIQVYACNASLEGSAEPSSVPCPTSRTKRPRNWNRIEVADWIEQTIAGDQRVMIGMDHGFSFPIAYFERYGLKNWNDFRADFVARWKTDLPDATVEQFRKTAARTGAATELRLTERWSSSAKSVFQFDVQGSVAKSTHAGLPFLHRLKERHANRIHVWPFDGWKIPRDRSVIAEIYPSLFRNRYPRDGRSPDRQDAYAVSRWLAEMSAEGWLEPFFAPPLTPDQRKIASVEGWILGVM